MTIEEDISEFYKWAIKLGFPQEVLPNEDALKAVFKSNQRDLFCQMMRRLKPVKEVQAIKENILIKKVSELKDGIVPASKRRYLPQQLQNYLQVKDLQQQKKALEDRLQEKIKEEETLAAVVKTKNIKVVDLESRVERQQTRCDILDFKLEDLNAKIAEEEKNKQKIVENMPVQITVMNAKEQLALEAAQKALEVLQDFNAKYDEQNATAQQDMRNNLWSTTRSIFSNIPNYFLFNAIMRLNDENLQKLMQLRSASLDDSKFHNNGTNSNSYLSKEPFNAFEKKLMHTKAELLSLVAQYQTTRQQRLMIEETFAQKYNNFLNELRNKILLFNAGVEEDHMDEVISDYLVQLHLRNFKKNQNDCLQQQIEQFKNDLEQVAKQLENHDVLLGTVKQIYQDINADVNRIQLGKQQLSQVKNKILYTKNLMINQIMVQQQLMSIAKPKQNNTNISILGAESFVLGNDNVMSSTRLDFDASIQQLSNTLLQRSPGNADLTMVPCVPGGVMSTGSGNILPPHSLELQTFMETPIQKLRRFPKEIDFHLSPNPLITGSNELTSILELAPGILSTPFGALAEVKQQIHLAQQIEQHLSELKLDLELTTVDSNSFKQRLVVQRERIAELLDKIDCKCIATKRMLRKLEKYYDFILENQLRNYVPTTKLFMNQGYADFEAEYLMYYRMATVGGSISASTTNKKQN